MKTVPAYTRGLQWLGLCGLFLSGCASCPGGYEEDGICYRYTSSRSDTYYYGQSSPVYDPCPGGYVENGICYRYNSGYSDTYYYDRGTTNSSSPVYIDQRRQEIRIEQNIRVEQAQPRWEAPSRPVIQPKQTTPVRVQPAKPEPKREEPRQVTPQKPVVQPVREAPARVQPTQPVRKESPPAKPEPKREEPRQVTPQKPVVQPVREAPAKAQPARNTPQAPAVKGKH